MPVRPAPVLACAGELNQQILQLTRAMHALRTHVAAHSPGGMPWSTYTLLFHLVANGPQRARALAECSYVDPSTVSRQVDQLVRLGLVERRADPADGRATLLAATEAGCAVHRRLQDVRARMVADLLDDWAPEDVERLTALLGRLNEDISTQMPTMLAALTAGAAEATAGLTDPTPPADREDAR
jgi:DNA-binding MarR family transcriptional regulator